VTGSERCEAAARRRALGAVGLITAALVLLALVFDMPAALGGNFFSDCATYYALAGSLAHDFDLEYDRPDLERVYADYSGGPSGIFLQRDRQTGRLYYGKAYVYPLVLAPAVRLLGQHGILFTHALLAGALLLGMTIMMERRWGAMRALTAALCFLVPSVATVYYLWTAPEFFNFVLIFAAFFFWLYKEVNPREAEESPPRRRAALLAPWTDVAAAAQLGVATYSKLSNGVMILPLVLFLLVRKRWWRLAAACAVFAAVVLLMFGAQQLATGYWNYQGGERKSFTQQYPFANDKTFDDASQVDRETDIGNYSPHFDLKDFLHNIAYFFFGRFGGIAPYYFPAFLALILLLIYGRRRSEWYRWLVLGGAALAALVYIVMIPTNVIGGGGTVANRYFMNIMPLFFFLLPERTPRWFAPAAALAGVLLIGHILLAPISTSQHPAYYAETPVLRLLPVEYTMLNDLPLNTESERRRVPWYQVRDGKPEFAFFLYHLDHNSYLRGTEGGGGNKLWVKGRARAELVLRTVDPLQEIIVTVSNISRSNNVHVSVQGSGIDLSLGPNERKTLRFSNPQPFVYNYLNPSCLYTVIVETSAGVTPRTQPGGTDDWRYLGALLEFEAGEKQALPSDDRP
jgi:hypothetical protein